MIPTLEELRKRLLPTPEIPIDQPPSDKYKFQTTSSRTYRSLPPDSPETSQPRFPEPNQNPFAQLLEDDDPFAEIRAELERAAADIEDAKADVKAADPPLDSKNLETVALVFGSPAVYEEHLARLADASRAIRKLGRVADGVFEPLKIFRDKVQRLRVSYEAAAPSEPATVFRRRLGRLLPPEKELETFDRTAVTFGGHLFELSRSLESAKALHARLVSLARAFDAAEALQTEFNKLARKP
jgi:hypothetical protein